MPPERVPGLAALVDACLDVPTSYWRTFADAGFAFLLAENLGRLAKGWMNRTGSDGDSGYWMSTRVWSLLS